MVATWAVTALCYCPADSWLPHQWKAAAGGHPRHWPECGRVDVSFCPSWVRSEPPAQTWLMRQNGKQNIYTSRWESQLGGSQQWWCGCFPIIILKPLSSSQTPFSSSIPLQIPRQVSCGLIYLTECLNGSEETYPWSHLCWGSTETNSQEHFSNNSFTARER